MELAAASVPALPEAPPSASVMYLSLRSTNAGTFTFVLRSDLGVMVVLLDEVRSRMQPFIHLKKKNIRLRDRSWIPHCRVRCHLTNGYR